MANLGGRGGEVGIWAQNAGLVVFGGDTARSRSKIGFGKRCSDEQGSVAQRRQLDMHSGPESHHCRWQPVLLALLPA